MNSNKYKDSYYPVRAITDLRDMIDGTVELYSGKNAFLVKDSHDTPYRPISFAQFGVEIHSLGTKFIDMGLKDKKIAIIGENSYKWVVSYFATTNGTGVTVPIDRELKPHEIANLINRSGAAALVHSEKMKDVVCSVIPLLDHSLEYIINMDETEDVMGKTVPPKQGEELEKLSGEAKVAAAACAQMYNPKMEAEFQDLCWGKLLMEGRNLLENGDRRFADAEIDPKQMASLLFTSGTTGLAKGVMLSHENLAANVENMSKYVNVDNYIGLSVLPMHHTYEMTCHVFTGLYQGFCMAICEGLKHIMSNMAEAQCTIMLAVPMIYETIHKRIMKQAQKSGQYLKLRRMIALSRKLKLYNKPGICKKIFKSVHQATGGHIKLFIAGGAAIDPRVIEDFEAMGFPMIQGYGMTENAPIIAVNRDRCSKAAAAGFPMPGTDIKIVNPDEDGLGEIYCKGPSVMLGYYDDPAENEKALVDGWLNTGDYGYFDKDGYLYVSGRKKNVIVSKNGKNIFPEEVEFYLQQSDFIEEVLVHGVEDKRTGDTVVKAEIFPAYQNIQISQGELSPDEIKSFLKKEVDKINELMPVYKRVRRIGIRTEEFSKTTTRKIKRYTPTNMESDEEL